MNILVISFKNIDVSNGINQLIDEYKDKELRILLPVNRVQETFTQSVLKTAIENNVKTTCFFDSAVGLDHILKQADDISLAENPIKEAMRQLSPNDAMAMVWDDSPQSHFILHGTEDLGLETWDITDGLDTLDTEDMFSLDGDNLHAEMTATLGRLIDLMCAFVANTVMLSLGEAVAEHIMESEQEDDKRDIDPFDNLD